MPPAERRPDAGPSRDAPPAVALFVTCMVDAMYPEVGMAAARLLERHGVAVRVPDGQTCCGQPAFNAGHREDARRVARHFLDVFWPLVSGSAVHAVVAPSGSCVAMVRHYYRVLFEDGGPDIRERVRALGERTYELSEYLVDVLGVTATEAAFGGRLTYHPCCHLLRELRVDEQPRRLVASLRGAEVVALAEGDACCGFGGLFSVKNASISTAMGRRKARNLDASGADVVVVNDVSCMTHLNGILERDGHRCRARHIAEVLAPGRAGGPPGEQQADAG